MSVLEIISLITGLIMVILMIVIVNVMIDRSMMFGFYLSERNIVEERCKKAMQKTAELRFVNSLKRLDFDFDVLQLMKLNLDVHRFRRIMIK